MKNKHCCLGLGKKFLREPSQWTEEPSLKTARSFGLMVNLEGDGGTTVTIIKLIIFTYSVDIFVTINMMNIIITA